MSDDFTARQYYCPCCGRAFEIKVSTSGHLIVHVSFAIERVSASTIKKASPKGDVRPDGVSEGVDAPKAGGDKGGKLP